MICLVKARSKVNACNDGSIHSHSIDASRKRNYIVRESYAFSECVASGCPPGHSAWFFDIVSISPKRPVNPAGRGKLYINGTNFKFAVEVGSLM